MNNKQFIRATLLAAFLAASFAGPLRADEKWNVLIAGWKALTPGSDPTAVSIIRKSLKTWLEQVPYFSIKVLTQEGFSPPDFASARALGISNRCDIVIYGSYLTENGKIAIDTEIYDVLRGEHKMGKVYEGAVTVDIFDTIDAMIKDMLVKVREVIPRILLDDETRIREVRKTLFEPEKVAVKRLFYTRLGVISEFGPKSWMQNNYSSYGNSATIISNSIPLSALTTGLALRFWDFRLDIMLNGMPGIPLIDYYQGRLYGDNPPFNYVLTLLSWYLPFWDGQLALGLGGQYVTLQAGYDVKDGVTNYNTVSYRALQALSLVAVWDPSPDLEFSLTAAFLPDWTEYHPRSDGGTDWGRTAYSLPPVRLGAIWFPTDTLGLELNFVTSIGTYQSGTNSSSGASFVDNSANIWMLAIYAGVVYRVNFLDAAK